jgi:DNA end-binding protein Ku
VALRQRESLATLRSRDGVLVLETLLWPDEIRPAAFPFLEQDIEVRPQELTMAASLIDSMTADFDPAAHHDGYREALIELVDAKVAGHEIAQPSALEIAAGPSTSLADALRASLAAAQQVPGIEDTKGKAKAIGGEPGAAKEPQARSGRASSAKGRAGESGATRASAAKPSPAKPSPARTSRAKTSQTAKPSAAKPGTAKAAPAKTGEAKKPARKAS